MAERRVGRRCLKTELGGEARLIIAVNGIVAFVPHIPDVFGAVSVGVGYKEDTDRVSAVLEEIVAGMRGDPLFQGRSLGDFNLWGVDRLGDFAVTVAGQVKTTPAGRWSVQREINRRIKRRFQALGIELPFPVQTVLFGGGTPPSEALGEASHADNARASPSPRADPASPPPQALDHMA